MDKILLNFTHNQGRENTMSDELGLPHTSIYTPPTLEFSLFGLFILHVSISDLSQWRFQD